jgi:hypothetical protein
MELSLSAGPDSDHVRDKSYQCGSEKDAGQHRAIVEVASCALLFGPVVAAISGSVGRS